LQQPLSGIPANYQENHAVTKQVSKKQLCEQVHLEL